MSNPRPTNFPSGIGENLPVVQRTGSSVREINIVAGEAALDSFQAPLRIVGDFLGNELDGSNGPEPDKHLTEAKQVRQLMRLYHEGVLDRNTNGTAHVSAKQRIQRMASLSILDISFFPSVRSLGALAGRRRGLRLRLRGRNLGSFIWSLWIPLGKPRGILVCQQADEHIIVTVFILLWAEDRAEFVQVESSAGVALDEGYLAGQCGAHFARPLRC